MDSLTQVALGAAVGELLLGKHIGNRAIIAGAILGTLPDLDVLVPFNGAVENFTYHRSFSHSFITLTLISPGIAWLLRRFMPSTFAPEPLSYSRVTLAVWLILITHVLLDCFTVYGTQVMWPLWNYPVGWATIFIVDPLYTMPLIIGLLIAWRSSQSKTSPSKTNKPRKSLLTKRRWRANLVGIALSSLYLCWTVVAQFYVTDQAKAELAYAQIDYQRMIVTPTPFSILWRVVAKNDDNYYEGFHSLLDRKKEGRNSNYRAYPINDRLLDDLAEHWPVARLKWFTHGFYAASQKDNTIVISDLRMGVEANYVFSFKVADVKGDEILPRRSELLPFRPDFKRLNMLVRRVANQDIAVQSPLP